MWYAQMGGLMEHVVWMNWKTQLIVSEIEAIVGALEPIEESDVVEVLATWKQTRTDPGEAQWRSENTCVPTLQQHVNHHPETLHDSSWSLQD